MTKSTVDEIKQRGSASLLKRMVMLRKERGLSQAELGRKAGLTPAAISKLESGKSPDPAFSTVLALSYALNVPIDVLAGIRAYPEQESMLRATIARLEYKITQIKDVANTAT